MNLLLLEDADFIGDTRASLSGTRLQRLLLSRELKPGDELRVGRIGGNMGRGRVVKLAQSLLELSVQLDTPPPPALPVQLIIGLPRPKMIKRILQHCATLGVKRLLFINSYRVEKSYWQSPLLDPPSVRQQLLLGLEQAIDTVLPEVHLKKRFKPCIEDELPAICRGRRALLAHPGAGAQCPVAESRETVLVVGPEGGFIDYEVDKLQQAGCSVINLGPRILRTETAVPVLLARLFPVTA